MAAEWRRQPLATLVAKAFNRLGFTARDLLTGQIVHTDLPWQCPPLESQAPLEGIPFSRYLEYPAKINSEKLYDFWTTGLDDLWHRPTHAIGANGWRGAPSALPGMADGERALRLSIPDGFPEAVDPYAGIIFSLEVAKIFLMSEPTLKNFTTDASNYYVTLANGVQVGVVDGKPACQSFWEFNVEGMVDSYIEAPRGAITTACRYDLLAKIRSVLWEQAEKFAEFEGLDLALQTLAIRSQNRLCSELQRAVEHMPVARFIDGKKIKAVEEAIALMEAWSMNDRIKITSMQEILVPEVLTASQFQRSIFNTYLTIPPVLAASTEKKILTFLRNKKASFEKDMKA